MKYKHMDESMNVTWNSHLPINSCVKCVSNAWYYCLKCTNFEWIFFAQFSLLSREMLSLWCMFGERSIVIKKFL
jgi:hypothetical protein